jgi:hypothetical protein
VEPGRHPAQQRPRRRLRRRPTRPATRQSRSPHQLSPREVTKTSSDRSPIAGPERHDQRARCCVVRKANNDGGPAPCRREVQKLPEEFAPFLSRPGESPILPATGSPSTQSGMTVTGYPACMRPFRHLETTDGQLKLVLNGPASHFQLAQLLTIARPPRVPRSGSRPPRRSARHADSRRTAGP